MLETLPVLETLLTVGLVALGLLSLNLVVLTAARRLAPPLALDRALPEESALPQVLVQVPLYNEGDLVRRILGAITAFDWPRDRLQIQVLDDSTDGSCAVSHEAVDALRASGFDIQLLHRTRRTAFKAGALAAGLEQSQAPYVAVFDADFIPPPHFLRDTLAVLAANPRLAYVQTRWVHLNPGVNLLTRAQARLIDAHFRVEQEARQRLGLPVSFNGTCGLWRRAAIDDAGGWHGDTLTEDLDLSLRAHLRGWGSAFLSDLTVPGALPESAQAWRAQQFRWTKGFVQCARKLLPMIWRSPALPVWKRVLVSAQMTQPVAFLIGLTCTLLGLPFIAGAAVAGPVVTAAAIAASVIGMIGTLGFLAAGVTRETARWAWPEMIASLFLSTGLLLSNARAVVEALLGHRSDFVRTPKSTRISGPVKGLRCGLAELTAGLGLLGFTLAEEPRAVFYLTLVIGGLVVLGWMQLLDGRALRPLRPGR